jgi:hypothetical protein
LARARGRIQRNVASLIESRLGQEQASAQAKSFRQRHREAVKAAKDHGLPTMFKVGPALSAVFLDPPFRLEPAAGRAASAVAALQANAALGGKSLVVLGPSGIGKTRLLREALVSLPSSGTLTPVFVPAALVGWTAGGAVMDWTAIPGVSAEDFRHLEALAREGKLAIFLDGLDENPALLETSVPGVAAFWSVLSRNRCFITCRTKFYQQHFIGSAAGRLLGDPLGELTLLDWPVEKAQSLYRKIAAQDVPEGSSLRCLEHLTRLAPGELAKKMRGFELTALSAWAYALIFASHPGGRFPDNEYAVWDGLFDMFTQWERGHNPSFPRL